MFRSVPNCVVFYPSDGVSCERAVELAANYKDMAYIRATRGDTPIVYKNDETFAIGKAKVIVMVPKLINMSEGSAVEFRFYEALRETTIGLKNRLGQEIGGKITMIFHKLTLTYFYVISVIVLFFSRFHTSKLRASTTDNNFFRFCSSYTVFSKKIIVFD